MRLERLMRAVERSWRWAVYRAWVAENRRR